MNVQIIKDLLQNSPKNYKQLHKIKRQLAKKYGCGIISNSEIIGQYHKLLYSGKIKKNKKLEEVLKKRAVRTLSGVAVISVLTKPFPCPGACVYCPSEPRMPKSYLSNEPAAMRAVRNNFRPYKQVQRRIEALEANGHEVDKIELIVLGGTWSFYPRSYQSWFIKECFRAANEYQHITYNRQQTIKTTLLQEQKKNEKARYRIIGVSLETRPDHIDEAEIGRLRRLGCTRIQLGAQTIYDDVLQLIKRGHGVRELVAATKLLKDAGFKVDFHLMPNLPGSTPGRDLRMFKKIFANENYRPDQLKIYPCIVNKYAELYSWYKEGRFKPYSPKTLLKLLVKIKKIIPYYVRLNRLIRDIPEESIIAGNKITNLREYLKKESEKQNVFCKCIRCREARGRSANLKEAKLFMEKYQASGGTEYFISYENKTREILYAFVRLRLPRAKESAGHFIKELRGAALLRELHTYGQLARVGEKSPKKKVQHEGFGKRLMKEAEKIAREEGFKKMAVISGIGVREYYRKLGYRLEGTYMVKLLINQ